MEPANLTREGHAANVRRDGSDSVNSPSLGGVEGALAFDGDAVALAFLGPVVPQRQVLGAAVVPEGDGVGLPVAACRMCTPRQRRSTPSGGSEN